MSYLDLVNQFWKLNKECCFTASESQLYFKLLDTCNSMGWRDIFYSTNMYICAETGMSERTLIEARKHLQEFGLIQFISGKRRREITQYRIVRLQHYNSSYNQKFADDYTQELSDGSTLEFNDGSGKELSNGNRQDLSDRNRQQLSDGSNLEFNDGNSKELSNGNRQDSHCCNQEDSQHISQEDSHHISQEDSHHFSQEDSQHFSQDFNHHCKNASDKIRTIDKDKDIDKDKETKEDKSSSSTCVDTRVPVSKIIDEYNRLCFKLPKATSKTDKRAAAVRARVKEHGQDAVMRMLKIASESDFLSGSNKNGWTASFDWLFCPANFVKVLEGNYNNRLPSDNGNDINGSSGNGSNSKNKPSPLQLIEEAYNNILSDGTFTG